MSEAGKKPLSERAGDEAIAEALRIAERRLIKLGWNYGDEQVGKVAAAIIAALDQQEPSNG